MGCDGHEEGIKGVDLGRGTGKNKALTATLKQASSSYYYNLAIKALASIKIYGRKQNSDVQNLQRTE